MARKSEKRRKKPEDGPFAHGAYTVRKKFWKFFGAAFYILDEAGSLIGYCSQKAFKLKEDIRVYTDESMTEELLVIKARNIIDFGATYDVSDPASDDDWPVGSYRRKGWTSLVRDEWLIFDADEEEIGKIQEDDVGMAILRRLIGGLAQLIAPQGYHLEIDGAKVADLLTSRNPFIYKLNVTIDPDEDVDPRMILAGAILLAAIEGRQGGGGLDIGG